MGLLCRRILLLWQSTANAGPFHLRRRWSLLVSLPSIAVRRRELCGGSWPFPDQKIDKQGAAKPPLNAGTRPKRHGPATIPGRPLAVVKTIYFFGGPSFAAL